MPATQNAHNLAAYLVSQLGRTETLKLQKLMYYCNAWSLAIRNKPVFTDPIQAWKHGPVVASIYPHHRGNASIDSWKLGDAAALDEEARQIADAMLVLYGARSGWSLRNLTHEEDPWKNAWDRCEEGARPNEVITHEEMKGFYGRKIRTTFE